MGNVFCAMGFQAWCPAMEGVGTLINESNSNESNSNESIINAFHEAISDRKGLQNAGHNCEHICTGPECDFCGTGLCCKKGSEDGLCDGVIGGVGRYSCVLPEVNEAVAVELDKRFACDGCSAQNCGISCGRCGPLFDGAQCPGGGADYCNSENGWCGHSHAHKAAADADGNTYDAPDEKMVGFLVKADARVLNDTYVRSFVKRR